MAWMRYLLIVAGLLLIWGGVTIIRGELREDYASIKLLASNNPLWDEYRAKKGMAKLLIWLGAFLSVGSIISIIIS